MRSFFLYVVYACFRRYCATPSSVIFLPKT